jgi:hypothetical protein
VAPDIVSGGGVSRRSLEPDEDYPEKTWVKAVAFLLVLSLLAYFTLDYGFGTSWLGTLLALATLWFLCGLLAGFLSRRDGFLSGFLLGCLLGPLAIVLLLFRRRKSRDPWEERD